MKAVWYDNPGGPEVLVYGDRPDPSAGTHDVVVKVHTAAVNHLDVVQYITGSRTMGDQA